ncbi:MAG: glycoside hydrolase family 3 protein [Deltaproteobacteria bacterium]|nr:glycoside hydrolase family 3 protein [Deltaproteobacteria bacterium]
MTDRTLVGEHFMLGFRGLSVPAWLREFAGEFGLGGVILFDRDVQLGGIRNVESPAQVRALCAEVHALPGRPLVFVDQEGGKVRRLKAAAGFCELPSAKAFARLGDAEARACASASCAEMKALGIDFDLAPVVDLDTNPDNPNIGKIERAFSADPREVARCARIYGDAARAAGLGLCVKHFPGLGGARTDSHLALTDLSGLISREQEQLFTALAGELPGRAALFSHGFVREWDAERPASISPVAVARFRAAQPHALLVTDDLQMQGLQGAANTVDAVMQALAAGLDLLCIGNNLLAQADECLAAARQVRARAERDAAFAQQLAASRARIADRKRFAAGP